MGKGVQTISCLILLVLPACSRSPGTTQDPLTLATDVEIREVAMKLIHDGVGGGATASESRELLVDVMTKLRDGWQGYQVTEYHASEYGPHSLLTEIYWEIAKAATAERAANRYEMLTALWEGRPKGEDAVLAGGWQRTLEHFGLENLHRETP